MLALIQWGMGEEPGRPELAGAELAAAAGARARAAEGLEGAGRPPEGLCGTLVAPGAR